jgi:hypothetical protein
MSCSLFSKCRNREEKEFLGKMLLDLSCPEESCSESNKSRGSVEKGIVEDLQLDQVENVEG